MEIAIVGGGFAGLAAASALAKRGARIHLFDPTPIGQSASGLASGLIHPFMGVHARRAWASDPAFDLALESTKSAQIGSGILRPALHVDQASTFQKRAKEFPQELDWIDIPKLPGLQAPYGALFVRRGSVIDVKKHLQNLWENVQGVWHQKRIEDLSELNAYDATIVAMGYQTSNLLPVQLASIKGQLLELAWPEDLPPLTQGIIAGGYLAPSIRPHSCIAGATFERTFETTKADVEVAKEQIMKRILPFFPPLEHASILGVRAGVRAAYLKTHLPLLDQVGKKTWVVTALGSKGLLYHSWLGELVAEAVFTGHPLPNFLKVT